MLQFVNGIIPYKGTPNALQIVTILTSKLIGYVSKFSFFLRDHGHADFHDERVVMEIIPEICKLHGQILGTILSNLMELYL